MVVVPYALDSDDMKMWVAPAHTPAMWLQYACDTFDLLLSKGRGSNARGPRMMSIGLHLRIIGRPGRIGAFHRFLQHVRQIGGDGVWVATRRQIAEHCAAHVPAPIP